MAEKSARRSRLKAFSIHHPLKGLSSILEAEREAEKLKEDKRGDDGRL